MTSKPFVSIIRSYRDHTSNYLATVSAIFTQSAVNVIVLVEFVSSTLMQLEGLSTDRICFCSFACYRINTQCHLPFKLLCLIPAMLNYESLDTVAPNVLASNLLCGRRRASSVAVQRDLGYCGQAGALFADNLKNIFGAQQRIGSHQRKSSLVKRRQMLVKKKNNKQEGIVLSGWLP